MLNSETQNNEKPPETFVPSEFIQEYCRSENGLIRDPVLADAVWISFCRHMLRWLLGKKKPVDIFFARLVPLLARKNWASVLAQYEMGNNKKGFHEQNIRSMIKRQVHESALNPRMVAMNGDRCDWTLEVMTNQHWDKQAQKIEDERQRQFGDKYLKSVLRQMIRQLPDLILAYAHFLAKARLPGLRIIKGHIVVRWSKASNGKRWGAFNPWIGIVTAFSESEDRSDPTLETTDASLPEVSNLRPGKKKMWKAHEALQQWKRYRAEMGQCVSGSTG